MNREFGKNASFHILMYSDLTNWEFSKKCHSSKLIFGQKLIWRTVIQKIFMPADSSWKLLWQFPVGKLELKLVEEVTLYLVLLVVKYFNQFQKERIHFKKAGLKALNFRRIGLQNKFTCNSFLLPSKKAEIVQLKSCKSFIWATNQLIPKTSRQLMLNIKFSYLSEHIFKFWNLITFIGSCKRSLKDFFRPLNSHLQVLIKSAHNI